MGWYIKDLYIKSKVVLAPMAGISNYAYMKIVEKFGCGLCYTELISSEAIVRNNKKTLDMLKGYEKIKIPVALQLFGSNPNVLAFAAKKVLEIHKFPIIDINMGCPVPKVSQRAKAGAYLLKDLNKIKEIVEAVCSSVDVLVSVKIRTGWDKESINAKEVAKVCEDAGASLICVHGRTRSMGYSGKADLGIIKEVKESVNIPVIGNGDIKTSDDALYMLNETLVDAVMVGRGAIGNPWIFKNINNKLEGLEDINITKDDKINTLIEHINYLLEVFDENKACLEARRHISDYLKGLKGANIIKTKIYKMNNIHDIILLLEEFKYNEKCCD